jgi:hypothetical protein
MLLYRLQDEMRRANKVEIMQFDHYLPLLRCMVSEGKGLRAQLAAVQLLTEPCFGTLVDPSNSRLVTHASTLMMGKGKGRATPAKSLPRFLTFMLQTLNKVTLS